MNDLKKTKAELLKELGTLRKQMKEVIQESEAERGNTEEDRKNFEIRFRKAQRMEAIGALAGGIAHEFNNILSPIVVHTEIALLDLPDDSPLRTNLEEVLKAGDRARDLTGQILALSRQEEEEPYPLKISPIVKEGIKLIRASLPATIRIQSRINTKSDTILVDPTKVYQVLMNLYMNAEHAMREKGGELTVSLDDMHIDAKTASPIPGLDPGSYIRLSVCDTGHGMNRAIMGKIFEPHFTTKKKGTGLGLSLVHDIVKSYKGAINVDSAPGKGTTFEIYFPVYESDPLPKPKEAIQLHGGDEKVL